MGSFNLNKDQERAIRLFISFAHSRGMSNIDGDMIDDFYDWVYFQREIETLTEEMNKIKIN